MGPTALWVAGYLAVTQTEVDAGLPLLRAAVDTAVGGHGQYLLVQHDGAR